MVAAAEEPCRETAADAVEGNARAEELWLGTDRGKEVVAGKPRGLQDLAPRPVDQGRKSCWAYFFSDAEALQVALATPPTLATRKLQAIAALLFAWSETPPRERSRIGGVYFRRESLPAHYIEDERATHPVAVLDVTHRALLSEDPARLAEVQAAILAPGAGTHTYNRDELIPTVMELLRLEAIAEQFRPAAQLLIRQCGSRQD